ncbi:hypothetical protein O4H66_14515 [Comamonadaceae bacterium G21597-S1]|nr:hypothetical protein [Comamonadaceae bacterium G21597-S1]
MTKSSTSGAARVSGPAARSLRAGVRESRDASVDVQAQADWHEQLTEDRLGSADGDDSGNEPVGPTSSANSASADPFVRRKALGEPVPQVTRPA